MQKYILTYYRLRKRKLLITLGSYRGRRGVLDFCRGILPRYPMRQNRRKKTPVKFIYKNRSSSSKDKVTANNRFDQIIFGHLQCMPPPPFKSSAK